MSLKKFQDHLKFKKGTLTASVTLLGYQNDDMFVFYAPALDLYAYGDDEKEAKESIDDTIYLYFEHVIEEQTLEKELKNWDGKDIPISNLSIKEPSITLLISYLT